MKRPTTLRPRTRLDAAVGFLYEYRHEIAYGLMVAAALLKSWNPIADFAPMKSAKARVVRSAKSTRTRKQ